MSVEIPSVGNNVTSEDYEPNCQHQISMHFHNFALLMRICLTVAGLVLNLGVIVTVAYGKVTQRRNAAQVIASMCFVNILYLLFIIIIAIPSRSFPVFGDYIRSFCLYCHLVQIGSNAPKALLTAHHLFVAVDTYWLIKRPFEYTSLCRLYFTQFFVYTWVVPLVYVAMLDPLTLCFYETVAAFTTSCVPRARSYHVFVPEIINIGVNFVVYACALGYIMSLYAEVFVEAYERMHRRSFNQFERRISLTSDSAIACTETYRQEVRLMRGFVILVIGTLVTASGRHFYYLLCIFLGCTSECNSGGIWRDFVFSTVVSLFLLLMVCFTPYAYFYRNPLFKKACRNFFKRVCGRPHSNGASAAPAIKMTTLIAAQPQSVN